MTAPSVSAVIPAYNRQNTIARAIRSALEQSVPPAEVIVVDDASSDDTVRTVGKNFPSVRIIRRERNQGAQAARAAGIRAAAGEWIAFLDSDDWWLPRKLEWQLDKAAEGFSVVHGPGLVRRNGRDEFFAIPQREGDIYAELLRRPGPLYPCLLARRECFEKASLPDPAIVAYQEWDMSLLLARQYPFGYVDRPLFVYEVQDDSISRDDGRGLRGYEQVVVKWWPEILGAAGKNAGAFHYREMAAQAEKLSGRRGRLEYLRLGARRTGTSFGAILALDCLVRARRFLGNNIPFLRAAWHALQGKWTTHG